MAKEEEEAISHSPKLILKRKTVLIFGISSYIGSNIAYFLKKDFRVIGTYFKNKVEMDGILAFPCDVLNRDQVQLVIFSFKPDFTIYAVGLSNMELCHKHPKYADALNTVGVFNVTENSERYKSRMILISTGYVFNGADRECLESDTPEPNTMYGKTKVGSEFYIQKSCLNYVIFRCCVLYGRSFHPRQKTFFEMLEYNLGKDQVATIDNNVRACFLDVQYLAMILKLCFERDVSNRLFQIASKDAMTYYEFAMKYAEIFNNNKALIQKGGWPFYPLEGYPGSSGGLYYKMDIFNIESFMGIEMPSIEESLHFSYHKYGGIGGKRKQKDSGAGVRFI